jgi:hypothetical protein
VLSLQSFDTFHLSPETSSPEYTLNQFMQLHHSRSVVHLTHRLLLLALIAT